MNIIFGHSHGFHLLREEWSEFTRNLPQRDSHLCAVCEKNYISYNNKKNENIYMAYIYIHGKSWAFASVPQQRLCPI